MRCSLRCCGCGRRDGWARREEDGVVKWGLPALAALLLFYPFILTGPFYWDIGVAFLLAAISASAWNIVGGYAGQVSVGHSMFFGVGAYTPLLFYHLWGLPPVAGVPAGMLISLVLAVAIGMQGPAVGRAWWDLTFRSELPYYYIFLAVLAVVLYTTFEVQRSRFGYYLRAIKAGERAARSLGVPVRQTKLKALMLSALFTSVAGSLYSIKTGFIDPESGFGILVSVQMVIVAALGGAGALFGPLVGALILVPLQTATNTWFGGGGSGLTYILYGGIIVLLARFEPGGMHEWWHRVAPFLARRKHAA